MKKKAIISSIVILAASIWGVHKYRQHTANPDADGVWVQVSKVRQIALPQEAHAIGAIVARSVEITPEIAGHVQKILVKDGAFVKEGDPLVQLDDAVFKAQNETAKAKLMYVEKNFNRILPLSKKGFVAQNEIDKVEADLKEKRADAEEKSVMWKKMQLQAPFAGTIGKLNVNPGDFVDAGKHVVTLTDTRHLRVEYNVPEKFLPSLKIGQDVKVTTSAYPGKVFKGKLSFISPTINTDNRSVSMYADISNENNQLVAGMFVNVTQSLDSQEKAMMIPARSLVPMLDGVQIYKVVDGKAYSATVLIGKRDENSVQILEGLSLGDTVITDGQLKIKNGMPVKFNPKT